MFIKELYLRSFGKFLYKKVILKDGLNIIYGSNEAGKSTIHNFIEIMLYDFKNNKGKYNAELYKKYRPWFNDQYRGSLKLEDDNNTYTIKRDFLTKYSKLYKYNVNESVTIDDYKKCESIGEFLFDINRNTFVNTLSIKQLANKTDDELAIEVKNKITNLSQTKDESISLENVLNTLNAIKVEAGEKNDTSSLLGQYANRVYALKKEKENAEADRSETLSLSRDKNTLYDKISDIELEISEINEELENYNLSLLTKKRIKADHIYDEIAKINEELSKYGSGKDISINDYEEALKLTTILEKMNAEKQQLEESLIELNKEIVNIQNDPAYGIKNEAEIVSINVDYDKYKDLTEKFENLKSKVSAGLETLESYNREESDSVINDFYTVEKNNQQIKINKSLINDTTTNQIKGIVKSNKLAKWFEILFGTLFLAGAGASCYAAYMLDIMEYYAGGGLVLITLMFYSKAGKHSAKVKGLKAELNNIKTEQDNLKSALNSYEEENKAIFEKNECEDFSKLQEKKEEVEKIQNNFEQRTKLIDSDKADLKSIGKSIKILSESLTEKLKNFNVNEINEEAIKTANDMVARKSVIMEELNVKSILLDDMQKKYKKLEKELGFEEKRFSIILSTNNINGIDELKNIINNNYKITELKNKRESFNAVLENVLDGYNYEDLKKKTQNIQKYQGKEFNQVMYMKDLLVKNEEKARVQKQIEDIDRKIYSLENQSRSLAAIEEEIEFYEDKIKTITEKIEAANIAIDKIKHISDYIKGDFMPLLKSAISENFSYVTDNKYKEVLIDEDMNISVVSEEKDEPVNINSLSGGTLDQLYISLRLGLSNLITDNKYIPLILDDSFIQYDEGRLSKSMEILNKESQRRQVILFTCQKRELEQAKRLGLKYNLIELD